MSCTCRSNLCFAGSREVWSRISLDICSRTLTILLWHSWNNDSRLWYGVANAAAAWRVCNLLQLLWCRVRSVKLSSSFRNFLKSTYKSWNVKQRKTVYRISNTIVVRDLFGGLKKDRLARLKSSKMQTQFLHKNRNVHGWNYNLWRAKMCSAWHLGKLVGE